MPNNNSGTKNFFSGGDFKNSQFKALIPEYYPADYKEYIRQETELILSKVSGHNRILEAGVGIGRLIPEIAPVVKEFVGVDIVERMLEESRSIALKYDNVRIIKADLNKISEYFPNNYFDFSLCVWNTLGNVDNESTVLSELKKITRQSILITTYIKGTIEKRKNWYETVGIKIRNIDTLNEIFYSESGLKSKSYSPEEIVQIAKKSGLGVVDSRVLNGVMLYSEIK